MYEKYNKNKDQANVFCVDNYCLSSIFEVSFSSSSYKELSVFKRGDTLIESNYIS